MEEQLQKLVELTSNKWETTIRLQGTESILKTRLENHIKLNQNRSYKVGLNFFTMFNQIRNIKETNNIFRYFNGTDWKTIKLMPGSYEINQIESEINRQMMSDGDFDVKNSLSYIDIIPRPETNRISANIRGNDYKIDCDSPNNIMFFFGFNQRSEPLEKGDYIAEKQAEIIDIHSIDIGCNLIEGGIVNGKNTNNIYEFPSLTVPIGAKIIERPTTIVYFPLNRYTIDEIVCEIRDENNNLIDLPGEMKMISLHVIQV